MNKKITNNLNKIYVSKFCISVVNFDGHGHYYINLINPVLFISKECTGKTYYIGNELAYDICIFNKLSNN